MSHRATQGNTGIVGNTAQMPAAKAAVARQDAADLAAAKSGTPVKAGIGTGSATASPGGEKRPVARAPGLRSKRRKPAAVAEPPAADDDEDVLGARLEALFNSSAIP